MSNKTSKSNANSMFILDSKDANLIRNLSSRKHTEKVTDRQLELNEKNKVTKRGNRNNSSKYIDELELNKSMNDKDYNVDLDLLAIINETVVKDKYDDSNPRHRTPNIKSRKNLEKIYKDSEIGSSTTNSELSNIINDLLNTNKIEDKTIIELANLYKNNVSKYPYSSKYTERDLFTKCVRDKLSDMQIIRNYLNDNEPSDGDDIGETEDNVDININKLEKLLKIFNRLDYSTPSISRW